MHTTFYKTIGGLLLMLCLGHTSQAQIITTIGGSGAAGFNGDGVATAMQLWAPVGVAVSGGNVYVADRRNNRVRVISAAGTISTIAGTDEAGNSGDDEAATAAQLSNAAGIAADGRGNIYIADKNNNRVRRIGADSVITAFAGSGNQGYGGDGRAATACMLNGPVGIAVDRAGNVYIADAGNNCIRKVTPEGIISTIVGTGKAGYNGDTLAAAETQINAATGIAVDSAGNVYIADTWNYRVRKVTPEGKVSTVAGSGEAGHEGDGKAATAAQLNMPAGVALDREGNIYIAELGNNRIRRVTTDGIITTYAGTGRAGYSGDGGMAWAADLNEPYGIAMDAAGYLYIAEQENNRIRRVTPAPPAPPVVKAPAKTKDKNQSTYVPPPFSVGGPVRSYSPAMPQYVAPQPRYIAPPAQQRNNGKPKG